MTRSPVFARNVVATSQPLATAAGLDAMRAGGNAVDAVLAAAITLTVVEPVMNGLGGDAFAILWDGEQLHGLNASGRSPACWCPERFAGRRTMPASGIDTVTVPGQISGWLALHERFGALPFERLFADAIQHARDGWPVPPISAASWAQQAPYFEQDDAFRDTFLPNGQSPEVGDIFHCPAQAETLHEIAQTRGESFYRGALAEKIVAHARALGGGLSRDDFASHEPLWVAPASVAFSGEGVYELPPNGQGVAVLIALGVLERSRVAGLPPDSAASVHGQIEAMKIAFAELFGHVADPQFLQRDPATFLTDDHLARRAEEIDPQRASQPKPSLPVEPGTVYLCAADAAGRMVSYIQSNYQGFGSGVVVPGTGIALHNRGAGFSLGRGHPNEVAGGKRPFHTIIPGFTTRGGEPTSAFGVMGAHMQTQGHVQVMIRQRWQGLDPQAALEAPRWHVWPDGRVALEPALMPLAEELVARGHTIAPPQPTELFGGGQIIRRLPGDTPAYIAGSDPRKDGHAAGF